MFLYHVLSAVAVGGVLVWIVVTTQWHRGIVPVVGAMSLHGVYSFSFLELWSLTQGSFSLSILDLFYTAGARNPGGIVLELEGIGASKKRSRIESLERLGLLRRRGQRLGLTIMGRVAATGLWIVAWTVNAKKGDR